MARIAYVAKYAFFVLFLFAKIFICAIFHAFSISAICLTFRKFAGSVFCKSNQNKCDAGGGDDDDEGDDNGDDDEGDDNGEDDGENDDYVGAEHVHVFAEAEV